ncbi:hypothetical protein BKA93DRAFT_794007 [Sparassis latifolia]
MESVCSDAELAQEMVKLLGNELKLVRQELRELKGGDSTSSTLSDVDHNIALKRENDQLKHELADLRLRLEAALEGQYGKSHLSNASSYDEVCQQLSASVEDGARKDEEYAQITGRLEDKLAALKGKYKKAKQFKEELKDSVSDFQNRLDDAVVKRDAALERAAISEASAASKAKTLFEAFPFLNMSQTDARQPPLKSLKPMTSGRSFCLSKAARGLCMPGDVIRGSYNDLVWPQASFGHCVLLTPLYFINPMAQSGIATWEKSGFVEGLKELPSQQRDLFYRQQDVWYYYGTFECIGSATLPAHEIRKIVNGPKFIERVEQRTTPSSELVPPVISKMIQNMYAEGILTIACIGFRYVGYNRKLDIVLQAEMAGKTIIPVPKEGSTGPAASVTSKRRHDEDNDGRSHKRSKAS